MADRPAYRTPYCLYCYAPMERIVGASVPCECCGKPNVKDDYRRYWALERKLVEIESLLKIGVSIVVTAVFAVILLNPSGGSGSGHGMAAGLPMLLGPLGWDMASITRRRTTWRRDLILAGIPGVLGAGILLFVGVFGAKELVRGNSAAQGAVLIGGALVLIAFAIWWWERAFRRWRERRVLSKQTEMIARIEELTASAG